MNRRIVQLSALFMVISSAAAAHAEALAYVRASSQRDLTVNVSRFHPINLLDGNPNTLWCEGASGPGTGETVQFVFKQAQSIDRVVITPAHGGTVRTLRLGDGASNVKLQLNGDGGEEVINTPLHGSTYTLTIEKVGTAPEGSLFDNNTACLADVAFYHGDQRVGASQGHGILEAGAERIIGGWDASPLGAPESSITFAVDGTWTWIHSPISEGPTRQVHGTYKMHGIHLLMRKGQTGRFVDMDVQTHRVVVEQDDIGAPAHDYDVITLGDALGKEFAGDYNNAQF